MFDSVTTDLNSKYDNKLDISIEAEINQERNIARSVFGILSVFTITIIPFFVEQNTSFIFNFENNSKKLKYQITKSMYSATWVGFLTLPLMPFYSTNSAANSSFREIIHSSLNEASSKSLF